MSGRWTVVRSTTTWYAVAPSNATFRHFPTWREAFDYADRMARRP